MIKKLKTPPAEIENPPVSTPNSELLENKWNLLNENETFKNFNTQTITLYFDSQHQQISGRSFCNNYSITEFELDENGTFKLGPLMSTKRYCPEINMENNYFNLLNQVNRFTIEKDILHLYKDNLELLSFEKQTTE